MRELKDFLLRHKNRIHFASDGCWIWTGNKTIWGYGQARFNGKVCATHRITYALYNQKNIMSLKGLHHKCKITICINPKHLEEINKQDHTYKYHLKFNPAEIAQIIDLYQNGFTQQRIADWYNTVDTTILEILRRNGIVRRTNSEAQQLRHINKVG